MNILVIAEDYRNDQYILKPLVTAMLAIWTSRAQTSRCAAIRCCVAGRRSKQSTHCSKLFA